MITVKQFAAALGFAFVAVWIDTNFGYAVLCLLGALAFYAAASFYQGDLDEEMSDIGTRLGGVTSRVGSRTSAPPPPPPGHRAPAPPPPPPSATAGPRVR
jgi:hypothetical protein